MMDGSMVFIRGKEEGWKELKLARVFAESSAYTEKHRGVIKESHTKSKLLCRIF